MTSTARDAARGFLTPQKSSSLRPTSLASPHTPVSRLSSQLYSSQSGSPSGTTVLHQLDEPLVFDIGTRFIRAGLANEDSPRCVIEMRPEYFGRVGLKGKGGTRGDIRNGIKGGPRFQGTGSEVWELWSRDLRDKDIGVVEDLLERMLREVYNKYAPNTCSLLAILALSRSELSWTKSIIRLLTMLFRCMYKIGIYLWIQSQRDSLSSSRLCCRYLYKHA